MINMNGATFKDFRIGEMVNLREYYRNGLFPPPMHQPMRVTERLNGNKTVRVVCKDNSVGILSTWELEKYNAAQDC